MAKKIKLSDAAKDLNISSKELVDFFASKGDTKKKPSSSLNEDEMNAVLEHHTKLHEVKNLDEYFNTKNSPKPEKKNEVKETKEAPKAEKKKETPKTEKKKDAPKTEKKASEEKAVKAEKPKTEKPKAEPVKEKAPVQKDEVKPVKENKPE